jgi:hypothetical protein
MNFLIAVMMDILVRISAPIQNEQRGAALLSNRCRARWLVRLHIYAIENNMACSV